MCAIADVCDKNEILAVHEMTHVSSMDDNRTDRVAIYAPDYSRTIYMKSSHCVNGETGESSFTMGLYGDACTMSRPITHEGKPLLISCDENEAIFPESFNSFMAGFLGVDGLNTELRSFADCSHGEPKPQKGTVPTKAPRLTSI